MSDGGEDYFKSSGPRAKGVNPLVLVGALSLMAGILALAFAGSRSTPECLNTILARATAPDGAHRAVLFARSCEKELPVEAHVSVLLADETFGDAPGNAAIVGDVEARAEGAGFSTTNVSIAWDGPSRLAVTYARGRPVVFDARSVGVVAVELREAATQPASEDATR